ncbi:MAG: PAS domain S-box protein [Planctomycetaceae bacterium]|nr:PAS domain S-box protein [Planctomycetaceae bacterium]
MSASSINFEQHLQLFSECVMDHAFYTLNTEGRVTTWNRGAQRLFGYTGAEANALTFASFYVLEARERQEPERDLQAAAACGQVEFEGRQIRNDGAVIDAYVVLTALRDNQQQLTGFAVVCRDLTQHQRALLQLQDQQRRLRSVLETAVDAIVIIDERGVIQSFNRAGERMFGYRAEEIIGLNVNILMPQPFAAEHTGYIQRYLRSGEARIIGVGREVQARRRDGSVFAADLAVSQFYDGKPMFTGILRDISDRKRMEAEVLQIAEAEQRRIGQELHDDAQQQLAGLTMIARHAADSLTPYVEGQPDLGTVRTRFERVVQGLKDANRSLRTLARGLVPIQIDAHGLIDALTQLAAQISDQHGVACRFVADEGIDVHDNGAATHLYRMTQEAVNNALKHAAPSTIVIRIQRNDGMVCLEIEDDGRGIDAARPVAGRGLQIMAYRAGLIGGILTVRRGTPGGTLVSCALSRLNLTEST